MREMLKPSAGTEKPRAVFYYGYIIVAAAFVLHLLAFSFYDSYGVFINPWIDEFGWMRAPIAGAYSLSFIFMGVFALVIGIMTDKYGPRLSLSICALCLGGGILLLSRIQSLRQLYLCYGVIIGIGMSGIWAPLLSLISRWFVNKRGLVTGIVIAGGGLGAFVGPPLITKWVHVHSWRNTSLIVGSVTLVIMLLVAQLLKRDPSQIGQLPDGERDAPLLFPESDGNDCLLGQAIKATPFWIIFAMFFCISFYTFSVLVHIMPYAIEFNIPRSSSAIILGSISGMSIFGNIFIGRICDKIGPEKIFIICFIMMSVALFWLVLADKVWMLYLFSLVFGFFHGGNATAQAPILASHFGLKAHGAIFGLAMFGFTLGGATGPVLVGYIFDISGSYQPAFLLCGLVGMVGLALTIGLKAGGPWQVAN